MEEVPIATVTETRILVERVRQLYARAPIGLAATGVNATLVVMVLWGRVQSQYAVAWLACQVGSVLVRLVMYLQFRREPLPDAREAGKWLLRFRGGALVSGLLWGTAAVVLYPHESLSHQIFLAFVLGGMVAGASGLFALDLLSFAAYSTTSLAPVILQLLTGGGSLQVAMGGVVFLFALLMGWVAALNSRSILTSLRLRVENAGLVESLTAEKERAELLNKDLSGEIAERAKAERKLRTHRDHLEELVEKRALGLAAANEQLLEVIADRERAEQQASRIAREWTSTFDNMLDMVAIISPDMKITRANVPLARFLSMHPRELVGRTCHEVLHGRPDPWPGCPHRESLETNTPITREINDPQGRTPLLVTCSPFTDGEGRVIGTVHVARDISDQKQAEIKREELIAQLQQAVANVKLLSGLLPICSACKKIRDDRGYWTQIETYIRDHSEAQFSHGICPQCAEELYPEYFDKKQ